MFTSGWNPGNLTGCEAGRKRGFVGNESYFAARPDGRYWLGEDFGRDCLVPYFEIKTKVAQLYAWRGLIRLISRKPL